MKKLILTLALIALTTVPALAESVRCRGELIDTGSSKYVTLEKCGKPDNVSIIGTKKIKSEGVSVETNIEEWFYKNLDYGDDYIIIVIGTRVNSVTRLDD